MTKNQQSNSQEILSSTREGENGQAHQKNHSKILTPLREGKVKVLLAEDNLMNQKVATRVLEKMGCEVQIAQNGKEAIAMWKQSNYDLIVMDCHMPLVDGYEATIEIRKLEQKIQTQEKSKKKRTPILALTADAQVGNRKRCLASGMDEYLTKPINVAALRQILEKWISLENKN